MDMTNSIHDKAAKNVSPSVIRIPYYNSVQLSKRTKILVECIYLQHEIPVHGDDTKFDRLE